MKFSRLVAGSAHLFAKIADHPVNRMLYKGTLSRHAFRFYLEQDELYLREFANALQLASKRLTNTQHAEQLRRLSADTIQTERRLMLKYMGEPRSDTFFTRCSPIPKKIPVIADYAQFLLHHAAFAPVEVAVASFIPCFWVYKELGKQMTLPLSKPQNPYRNWLASYSSARFILSTEALIQLADELNRTVVCTSQQATIISSFRKSAEFELKFFDAILAEEQRCLSMDDELTPRYS